MFCSFWPSGLLTETELKLHTVKLRIMGAQAIQASSINQNKFLRNAVQIFMYYVIPYCITALHLP